MPTPPLAALGAGLMLLPAVYSMAGVVVAGIMTLIVTTVSLRVAWRWLGMGYLSPHKARRVSLIASGALTTALALLCSVLGAVALTAGSIRLQGEVFLFWLAPGPFVELSTIWVLGLATLCVNQLTTQDDEPLTFSQAVTLAITTFMIGNLAYLAGGAVILALLTVFA